MKRIKSFINAFWQRGQAAVLSKDTFASTESVILAVTVICLWLAVVIFTVAHHEFWRDEVRAFSIARAASSPLDLYGLLRNEGHPVLWYLLLFIGKSIVNTPLVLPVVSILVALAAVAVFMFYAPFPFWFRSLFLFSFPLYEYSVMARNYGISMLLFFIAAMVYRNREKYAWQLAVVLALLANTNAHSAILVGLILVIWFWDAVRAHRTEPLQKRLVPLILPFIIVLAGILLCVLFVFPTQATIATKMFHIDSQGLITAFQEAVLHPENTFPDLTPFFLPSMATILLIIAILGLFPRPLLMLCAFAGQVALGVFFRVVYVGEYRHQGLFLIFLLFLYWILFDSLDVSAVARNARWILMHGIYGAVGIMILVNVASAIISIDKDVHEKVSAGAAFGQFLTTSDIYRNALIVPEPDFLVESLPYYASNKIFFPREHRFGTWVSFTTFSDVRLSLGELLSTARDLKQRNGLPVLIVLGHKDVDWNSSGEKDFNNNNVFSWTADDYAEFMAGTTLLANYKSSGDENYIVYAVK